MKIRIYVEESRKVCVNSIIWRAVLSSIPFRSNKDHDIIVVFFYILEHLYFENYRKYRMRLV